MASRASVAKHPVHPMLVVFPIGLWTFSLMCDVAFATGWGGPVWNDMAFYTMAGGVVGALLAAVPGFIDYRALKVVERPAQVGAVLPAVPGFIDYLALKGRIPSIALTHMLVNLAIVGLYGVNLFLRARSTPGAVAPVVLSALSVVLLGISGWLGGELVYVHGIAVQPQPVSEERSRKAA